MTEIIDLLVPASKDWQEVRKDSPVVKISNGKVVWYGVLGALVQRRSEQVVGGINYEVSERGGHSCLMGDISVEELESGEIGVRGGHLKVEIVGKASDPEFKDKKWSYWF